MSKIFSLDSSAYCIQIMSSQAQISGHGLFKNQKFNVRAICAF